MQVGSLQNQMDYEEARDLAGSLAAREQALQQDGAHLNQLQQQEEEHRTASEAIEQQLQSHVCPSAWSCAWHSSQIHAWLPARMHVWPTAQ